MTFEIKEGYSIDPIALQALYEHVPWARGRMVEEIRVMLAHTDFHFSAWDQDQLIGFTRILTDRVYRATLWDVVVHPDFQSQGVGEELLNRVFSHPVLSKVEKFWLNTRDKFSFYEKYGFVRSHQAMLRENPYWKKPL